MTTNRHVAPARHRAQESKPGDTGRAGSFSAGLLTLATVTAGLLNYSYSLVLTYYLRPSDYSRFVGAQALVLLVGVVGGVGVPYVVAQETRLALLSGSQLRLRNAVNFAFWANMVTGAVAGTAVACLVLSFAGATDALLAGTTIMVLAIGSTSLGIVQGRGQTGLAGMIIAGEAAVKFLAGITLVIAARADATSALYGLLAGALVLLATSSIWWHAGRPSRPQTMWALIRSAVRIGIVQLGVGIVATLDIYLVATTRSHDVAASYQIASTAGKVTLFVSTAVSFATLPLLNDLDALQHKVRAVVSYLLMASAIAFILLSVPDSVTHAVLPKPYVGMTKWLPYTAFFGIGIGLANLFTTFVQGYQETSPGRGARQAIAMVPLSALAITSMLAGCAFDQVKGVAITSLASAWMIAIAYGCMSIERSSVSQFAHTFWRLRRRIVVVTLLGSSLFLTAEISWAWTADALILGLYAAYVAFPEFSKEQRSQLALAG